MPRVWNRPVPFHRQAYAAIDLGTNNCRLLIARPAGEHFVVIDAFSRVVRLGEGLAQSGRLSDAAMDRALTALHVCAEKLRKRNVHLARSVATEACRRASNGAEFIDRVYRETGIRLNIITAQEEARLAVLGCHILLEHGEGPAMIFDIGGGSTEMVLVDPSEPVPRILDWQSVPWGSSRSPKARAPSPTAPRRARRPMRTCANAWPAALPRSPSASARPARAPSSAARSACWARAARSRPLPASTSACPSMIAARSMD
jgi:exopolyphosphatase/guanosine-5'-triphosphate,3'-diphosphate pyrophosphatase